MSAVRGYIGLELWLHESCRKHFDYIWTWAWPMDLVPFIKYFSKKLHTSTYKHTGVLIGGNIKDTNRDAYPIYGPLI